MRPDETYYVKRGRRYVQINDPNAYIGLTKGAWLVLVKPGSTSIRNMVDPDYPAVDAALRDLEDVLCDALREASKLRPMKTPITLKERKAWDVFRKTMGPDMPTYFCYEAIQTMVDEAIKAFRAKMLERTKPNGNQS